MQSSCIINTTKLICKIIHSSHLVLCKSSYVTIKTVAVLEERSVLTAQNKSVIVT